MRSSGAKLIERAVVHGLTYPVGDHDVVAVVCLRLDDHVARAVVQVRLTPVLEQMLAHVCAVQPGDVLLDQVLLQLALKFCALLDGERRVRKHSLNVLEQHPVATNHPQPVALQVLVHRPVDVAVAVPAVQRQEALVDGPAGLVPGTRPAQRPDRLRHTAEGLRRNWRRIARLPRATEVVTLVNDRPGPLEVELGGKERVLD
jgi:hypothetical protein